MKKSWIGLEGSFVLFMLSAVMAHGGDGGGVAGFCTGESLCHSFVDSFGHGVLGSGWLGFVLVFGIWVVGAYVLIRYLIGKLEIEIQELEQDYE